MTGPRFLRGLVRLPVHIRWSEPTENYNLEDPADLRRVYEQVLRSGTPRTFGTSSGSTVFLCAPPGVSRPNSPRQERRRPGFETPMVATAGPVGSGAILRSK
jgi:hypothetical protein